MWVVAIVLDSTLLIYKQCEDLKSYKQPVLTGGSVLKLYSINVNRILNEIFTSK